ncbi:hypothetical protein BDN71DRAFT_1485239 [Pleurotus eryngii]|uniref:Uncharacterized protein n=1 Tax=Pleurotus eryngii TaxID=5323 RepID=A0A9P5ZGI7_PLEER|nr:hypothetical protein BDN71DRAFT_1485239 [Pleurotus eryngii]
MFRKISSDVKIAAINLYERALLPLEDILDCCEFSQCTFFHILHLWRTTGSVEKPPHRLHGRRKLLAPDDVEYLLWLVQHRSDWFLDELVNLLNENRFISVHFLTICHELSCAGYSLKKLKKIAAKCNKNKCAAFVYHMSQYTPDQLSFIDETSKDDWIPATVVKGSMTVKTFYEFLQDNVVRASSFLLICILTALASSLLSVPWSIECSRYGQLPDPSFSRHL